MREYGLKRYEYMHLVVFSQILVIAFMPLYILRGVLPIPFGLFDMLAFAPSYIEGVPITLLEILILFSALITIVYAILTKDSLNLFKTKFDLLIVLFLISSFVSVFFSYDFYGGLGIYKAYFAEPILFYYCLIYQIRKLGYRYIFTALIFSGLWLGLLGVVQKITGSFTFAPQELALGRISGVYNSANSLALYLAPISLLSFSFFIQSKKKEKIWFLALFIFLSIIVILTRSRGGMIAQLLSLIVFTYIVLASKIAILRKYWYIVPGIVTSLIIFFLVQVYQNYNFIPHQYGEPYTQGDTIQIRYFIWAGTINMLKDHPIWGAGLNGFKTLYSNQYRLPQFQEQFQYPHNLILTFWAETGLHGLFVFLLIIVSAYGLLMRNLTMLKFKIVGAGLLSILSYWLIHGVVDVPYFKNDLSTQFWTIMAIISTWSEAKESS